MSQPTKLGAKEGRVVDDLGLSLLLRELYGVSLGSDSQPHGTIGGLSCCIRLCVWSGGDRGFADGCVRRVRRGLTQLPNVKARCCYTRRQRVTNICSDLLLTWLCAQRRCRVGCCSSTSFQPKYIFSPRREGSRADQALKHK